MNNSFSFSDYQPTESIHLPAISSAGVSGYTCTVPISEENQLSESFAIYHGKQLSEQNFSVPVDTTMYFVGRYNGEGWDITVTMPYGDYDPFEFGRMSANGKDMAKNNQDMEMTKNLISMIFIISIVIFSVNKISGYNLVNPLLSSVTSMLSFFLLIVIRVKEKEDNMRRNSSPCRALSI